MKNKIMMRANEFRIDNKVLYNGMVVDVFEILSGDRIGLTWEESGTTSFVVEIASELEPIRLTADILKKCGFTEDKEYADMLQHPHLKCRWVTQNLLGEILDIPFLRFDSTGRPPFVCTDIYCLHQLQNLYFAKTGKELLIKEQNPERSATTDDDSSNADGQIINPPSQ